MKTQLPHSPPKLEVERDRVDQTERLLQHRMQAEPSNVVSRLLLAPLGVSREHSSELAHLLPCRSRLLFLELHQVLGWAARTSVPRHSWCGCYLRSLADLWNFWRDTELLQDTPLEDCCYRLRNHEELLGGTKVCLFPATLLVFGCGTFSFQIWNFWRCSELLGTLYPKILLEDYCCFRMINHC